MNKRTKTTLPEGTVLVEIKIGQRAWLREAHNFPRDEIHTYTVCCGWVPGEAEYEIEGRKLYVNCPSCGTEIRHREFGLKRGGLFRHG